ncbi:MAG: heme-binding domain-containing protein [Leptospiraceae bacterium]|nr:heme-binding domain-containing protein [Leptospiraceae bacterium]
MTIFSRQKNLWITGILFTGIFVLIQVLPVKQVKIIPSTIAIPSPEKIIRPLVVNCKDCHSLNPTLPWYARINPVSFYINNEIEEAREQFIFENWDKYSKLKQLRILEKSLREIKNNEMPPFFYSLVNSEKQLTEGEVQALSDYIDFLSKQTEQHRGWIP